VWAFALPWGIEAPATICVRDEPDAVARKITKIVPYRDGGFAILAPYHNARRGFLMKYAFDYRQTGRVQVSMKDIVEYSADDRVKLSYHADGFVQFSSEGTNRIVSGRDPKTGRPRGIGVLTNPLIKPILTGPNCGITAWGLVDFAAAKPTELKRSILFSPDDFHHHADEQPDECNGILIEFFSFTPHFLPHIRQLPNGTLTLPLWHNGYEGHGAHFDFRVLLLPDQPVFLGVICHRIKTDFPASSGFNLAGPGEANDSPIKDVIQAMYPAPSDKDLPSIMYPPTV
jgi:hypothetical protein